MRAIRVRAGSPRESLSDTVHREGSISRPPGDRRHGPAQETHGREAARGPRDACRPGGCPCLKPASRAPAAQLMGPRPAYGTRHADTSRGERLRATVRCAVDPTRRGRVRRTLLPAAGKFYAVQLNALAPRAPCSARSFSVDAARWPASTWPASNAGALLPLVPAPRPTSEGRLASCREEAPSYFH
jgi:hypothetical protein